MAAALAEDGFHTGLELIQHLHRHESLHRAGETAAMDADSALIAQQMLGGTLWLAARYLAGASRA